MNRFSRMLVVASLVGLAFSSTAAVITLTKEGGAASSHPTKATLVVTYQPKAGTTPKQANRLFSQALSGSYGEAHEWGGEDAPPCVPSIEVEKNYRDWVLGLVEKRKVPVTGVVVAYNCRPD